MYIVLQSNLDYPNLDYLNFEPSKSASQSTNIRYWYAQKIAKSWDLGSCKRNKSVEFGEKLASVCLESSGMAYKWHK